MHAISSYRGNRLTNTNKPTNTPTDRTDYNTLGRNAIKVMMAGEKYVIT